VYTHSGEKLFVFVITTTFTDHHLIQLVYHLQFNLLINTASTALRRSKRSQVCRALHGKPIVELQSVTCNIGSQRVTWHPTQVNLSALNPAKQAGTRFTYPVGMKGWVDLGGGYMQRWFTCLQTVTHPSSDHLSAFTGCACWSEFSTRLPFWSTKSCTDSLLNTSVRSTMSPTCLAADLSVLLAPTVWQCRRLSW